MENTYEILEYLPGDDVEVNDYVSPLFNSANVMYEKEQYQFSYFAVHLIFMTYIYSTVWKIGQFHKDNYEHSLLFARPYNGSDVNLKEIKSVFDFSHLPEKDIFEFFVLIGLENGYIKSTKKLIDYRNEMAHATGRFQIATEEDYENAINEILNVTIKIHEKLSLTIRDWYREELLKYAKNDLDEQYSSILDYINNIFTKTLSFSQKELLVCKEFGLNKLKNRDESGLTRDEIAKIVEFHKAIKEKYNEIAGEE
jgi:DNA-binding XRE family transcriptional regulator